MICNLREDDWCERHKTFHKGRLKHWALSDTALGEQYRLLWDKTKTNIAPPLNKTQFTKGCSKCGSHKKT